MTYLPTTLLLISFCGPYVVVPSSFLVNVPAGPGTEDVQALRDYLRDVFRALHRAWDNATRTGQDEAAQDAIKEATEEVNLALKGVNRNPFKAGEISRGKEPASKTRPQPHTRRHRWECGSCGKR